MEGGPESRLLERIPTWAAWAVAERGIYFRKDDTKPRPSIEFFDFATQRVRRIALVKEGALEIFRNRWLSVSPDEKWLVYHGGTRDSDIMMVDHFK